MLHTTKTQASSRNICRMSAVVFSFLVSACTIFEGERTFKTLNPNDVERIPADERAVPGFAGSWDTVQMQRTVVRLIHEAESRRVPACADNTEVKDTVLSAPPLLEMAGDKPVAVHELERWTINRCDLETSYDVWYTSAMKGGRARVAVNLSGETPAWAGKNPAWERLKVLEKKGGVAN